MWLALRSRQAGLHVLSARQAPKYLLARPAGLAPCKTSHPGKASAGLGGVQVMKYPLIDIGANLLDDMFQGRYNGKDYHAADLAQVLQRSWDAGLERIILTATNLEEARAALSLARTDERLFCTVGVHPTRCGEIDLWPEGPAAYFGALREVLRDGTADGKVVAVGECGLDYDRLQFCSAATQRRHLGGHFALAADAGLPLFLHCRAACADLAATLREHFEEFRAGVVHSFDGTPAELRELLAFDGLRIGINGCSLKTAANLEAMAAIPAERLLIETDAPWCEIRPSHASHALVQTRHIALDRRKHTPGRQVKGRNEPCNLPQVLEVVAGYREVADIQGLAKQIYQNTLDLFFQNHPAHASASSVGAATAQQ